MNDLVLGFRNTLSLTASPADFSVYLQALWFDGKGDWNKAHDLVNDLSSKEAAHIHAYLHRKEGDLGNADYWYQRAGTSRPSISLDDEWEQLVLRFLT